MIKLANINKYYYHNKANELHVLNNLNLEFDDLGFVTILGPSGSGKSTLLNIIGGLDRASGEITFDEQKIDHVYGRKMDIYRNAHVGYIFQNYNLIPELTVYENLRVQLDLIHIKDQEDIDQRIDICLGIVGMEKYKRRNVTALSGGQQQRVAIARALVKGARVIIADEPTGNLDSKSSIEVMNILKTLSKKCLVILVTHNQNLAYHYSDRIIRIKDGTLLEDIKNENDNTLLEANQNTIYLEQYQRQVLSSEGPQVTLYSNGEDINLRIVVDKNTIYIENQSTQDIKVLGDNTEVEFKDVYTEYVMDEAEVQEKLNFKEAQATNFKQSLMSFLVSLKNAFLSFIFAPKKSWLVHFSFFLIGILLCLCLSSISYSTAVNQNILLDYQPEAVRVKGSTAQLESKYGFTFEYDEIKEIINNDASGVTGLAIPVKETSFQYRFIANRSIYFPLNHPCYVTTPSLFNYDEKLKGNEVVISTKVANDLITYCHNFGIETYEDIKGKVFTVNFSGIYQGETIIKDIVEFDNYNFLVSDEIFFNGWGYSSKVSGVKGIDFRVKEEGEEFSNLVLITDEVSTSSVYVSRNLFGNFSSNDCNIAGFFESEKYEVVFLNRMGYNNYVNNIIFPKNPLAGDVSNNLFPYENADIDLKSGFMPEEDGMVLLPDFLEGRYQIGSPFTLDYKDYYMVCGFFKSKHPINTGYLYANLRTAYTQKLESLMSQGKRIYEDIDFYTKDKDLTISYFENLSYETDLVRNIVLKEEKTIKVDTSQIAIYVSAVFAVIMVVFIFFISRSRIMHNIYTIGVYRALGAKKSRIYKKYLLDAFIMSTFTIILSFVLMYCFASYMNQYIYGLCFNGYYATLMILGIYILMILSAFLPVFLLLRKTPIEILGKYDI